jgi:hypothetical protein
MKFLKDLMKNQKQNLLLIIVLITYILLNIKTPDMLSKLIDTITGNIVVILIALYILASSGPIVGVLALYAGYLLIVRSSSIGGVAALKKFIPSESSKNADYSAFNNESDTLEQEIVKNMKPMITIPGPSDINVECGDENKK